MNDVAMPSTTTQCGDCGVAIDASSQFCSGCGQPVWQKCDCGCLVLLTQSFCNACGTNLDDKLQVRFDNYAKLFKRCEELRLEGRYADAIRTAKTVCQAPDYRFRQVSERAQKVVEQASEEMLRWNEEIARSRNRVERYQAADRCEDIVRILSRIPKGVLPSELSNILEDCERKSSALARCKLDLKAALAEKKYDDALSCLSQLVALKPSERNYQDLAASLVEKVLEKARRYYQARKFPQVIEMLRSIPRQHQDAAYIKLLDRCEEAVYLRRILSKSAFLSPLVAASLKKLEQLTPGDPSTVKLRGRLEHALQSRAQLTSEVWVTWMRSKKGRLGIPITPTRVPNVFAGTPPKCVLTSGSQFFVAIGLAAQAARNLLPKGEVDCDGKTTRVLGLLGARKSKFADSGWGIDIGDSSIKAVQLGYDGESTAPQIKQAVIVPLGTSAGLARRVDKDNLEAAVGKLLSEVTLGHGRVIVNISGTDLVSRHVALPQRLARKQIDDFMMQEARANIPISLDLIQTAYHVCEKGQSESNSLSAILVATRKQEVEFRKALIENAGLRIDAFLPEPFALLNTLQTIERIDSAALAIDEQFSENVQPGQELADMLIDVGLQRTNILISHAAGTWHRTLDWGTQDLSAAIAKALQLTQLEADVIRRDPLRAKHVQLPIEAMLAATQIPKRELERCLHAARDAIGVPGLRRVMLVGGGAYQPFLSSWLNDCEF